MEDKMKRIRDARKKNMIEAKDGEDVRLLKMNKKKVDNDTTSKILTSK